MGSAQGRSREVESETKEMRKGRRERGVGEGGGARCTLCGCAATDGDSAGSKNKGRMDLLLCFSAAGAVDIRSELTRVVRLEADRLVGPVVALAEQNAIGLVALSVRSVVAPSHTSKETFRGISAEGQTNAPCVSMSALSYWRAGSGCVLGGAMALALAKSRKGLGIR